MMRGSATRTSRRNVDFRLLAGAALAVLALYAYLWWVMDVPQMCHDRRREFIWGINSLRPFLGYVGGPLEYGYALLVQLYAFPWAGAAALTGVFVALYAGARHLSGRYAARAPWVTPLIPAAVGLVLVHSYMTLAPVAAVGVAVGVALLYIHLPLETPVARLLAAIAALLALHYGVGGAFHLCVAICVVHEFAARRKWLATGILVCGVSVPFATRFLFYEPDLLKLAFRNAPLEATVESVEAFPLFLYGVMWASFPLMILAGISEKTALGVWCRDTLTRQGTRPAVRTVAIIAAAVALSIPPVIQAKHCRWTVVERLVGEGHWEGALACVERLAESDMTTSHMANLALFKSGRLLDDMFRYPQTANGDVLLLDGKAFDFRSRTAEKRSATYLDLGVINRAERWTLESMNVMGELPHLVKQMVIINMVKRRPGAAAIYLGRLKQMPFQRTWALDYERKLRNDPLLERDSEVGFLRASMFKPDYVDTLTSEELLGFALATNPRNKMAFEYLVAMHLLTRRSGKVLECMRYLGNFGYKRIPRHCEEAVLSHAGRTREPLPSFGLYTVSPETIRRFNAFVGLYSANARDPVAARRALSVDFGDTYWFFEAFGRSGRAFALSERRDDGSADWRIWGGEH